MGLVDCGFWSRTRLHLAYPPRDHPVAVVTVSSFLSSMDLGMAVALPQAFYPRTISKTHLDFTPHPRLVREPVVKDTQRRKLVLGSEKRLASPHVQLSITQFLFLSVSFIATSYNPLARLHVPLARSPILPLLPPRVLRAQPHHTRSHFKLCRAHQHRVLIRGAWSELVARLSSNFVFKVLRLRTSSF